MFMIRETYVNKDKGYQYGNTEWYEVYPDNRAKLFRDLQREFGRCSGKVYVDLKTGDIKEIGYVFEKYVEYNDPMARRKPEYYMREVWVEIREVV